MVIHNEAGAGTRSPITVGGTRGGTGGADTPALRLIIYLPDRSPLNLKVRTATRIVVDIVVVDLLCHHLSDWCLCMYNGWLQVQDSATVEEVIRLVIQTVKNNPTLSARVKLEDSPSLYELKYVSLGPHLDIVVVLYNDAGEWIGR